MFLPRTFHVDLLSCTEQQPNWQKMSKMGSKPAFSRSRPVIFEATMKANLVKASSSQWQDRSSQVAFETMAKARPVIFGAKAKTTN